VIQLDLWASDGEHVYGGPAHERCALQAARDWSERGKRVLVEDTVAEEIEWDAAV
jgi:hypothetical protein